MALKIGGKKIDALYTDAYAKKKRQAAARAKADSEKRRMESSGPSTRGGKRRKLPYGPPRRRPPKKDTVMESTPVNRPSATVSIPSSAPKTSLRPPTKKKPRAKWRSGAYNQDPDSPEYGR